MKAIMTLLVLLMYTSCSTGPSYANAKKNDRASCKKIVEAAWAGNSNKVSSLLKSGVNPNCVYNDMSALLAASRFGKSWRWDGNLKTVKLLVANGADLNYKYRHRSGKVATPAYIAAYAGHTKTATYLVSQGASLEEAEKGHREYAAREAGSLAALGLMAQAANSFRKSLASSSTGSVNTPINNSDTSSSASRRSSNGGSNNVSTRHRGVSVIRSNGSISGAPSYQVRCKQGSTYIVYKKNGTWYRGGSGHMGNKYNSWSKSEVADYLCR